MKANEFQVGDKVEVVVASGYGHFIAKVLNKEVDGMVIIENRQGRQLWVHPRRLKCVLSQSGRKG